MIDVIEDPNITRRKSVPKIMFGTLLLAAAFALIIWNEVEPVHRYRVYQDGPGRVVELAAPVIQPENDGKLIFLVGPVSTDALLADRQLGPEINAIKLRRKVVMYQWHEETEPQGDKITYKYVTRWGENLTPTLSFKKPVDLVTGQYHVNPNSMLFESAQLVVPSIKIGDFDLPPGLVNELNQYEKYDVPESILEKFPPEWRSRVRVIDGEIYIGKGTPDAPKVGDYRVTYEYVKPGVVVSVLGQQSGQALQAFPSKYAGSIQKIKIGAHELAGMFDVSEGSEMLEWGVRIVALAVVFVGSHLFLSGFVSTLSSFAMMLTLASGVFAGAWMEHAMLGYGLFGLAAIGALMLLIQFLRHRGGDHNASESVRRREEVPYMTDPGAGVVETAPSLRSRLRMGGAAASVAAAAEESQPSPLPEPAEERLETPDVTALPGVGTDVLPPDEEADVMVSAVTQQQGKVTPASDRSDDDEVLWDEKAYDEAISFEKVPSVENPVEAPPIKETPADVSSPESTPAVVPSLEEDGVRFEKVPSESETTLHESMADPELTPVEELEEVPVVEEERGAGQPQSVPEPWEEESDTEAGADTTEPKVTGAGVEFADSMDAHVRSDSEKKNNNNNN